MMAAVQDFSGLVMGPSVLRANECHHDIIISVDLHCWVVEERHRCDLHLFPLRILGIDGLRHWPNSAL